MTRSEAHAQQIINTRPAHLACEGAKTLRESCEGGNTTVHIFTRRICVCLHVAQCTATALIGLVQSSPWLSMVTSECLSQARRLEQVAHGQSTPCRLHSIKRLLLLHSYTEIEDTPPAHIPRKTPDRSVISPSPTNLPRYPAKHISQA